MKTKFKINKKIKRLSTNEEGEVVSYDEDIYYPILIKINGEKTCLKITADGRSCQSQEEPDYVVID